MSFIVFDIETAPVSKSELEAAMPKFEAPKNYTDPAKIAKAIQEKIADFIAGAALSAETGQVCAIGIWNELNGYEAFVSDTFSEKEIIEKFWSRIWDGRAITDKIIGFNSNKFDVPFLVRRSWKLGISIPPTVLNHVRGRMYINEMFTDLMDWWDMGTRDTISLDRFAKFLGVGAKTGDGKYFHILLEHDKEAALAYLKNDINLTAECARKLGII